MKKDSFTRRIYTSDNLPILRSMDSGTVDLIYLDPPFNSGKQWENPVKAGGRRALASFKDTWALSDSHPDEEYALGQQYPEALPLIDSLYAINGGSWKAYLIYMGVRLAEMRRILKPTGSIYYHCDPTMSHGVKLLMDAIFCGRNGGELRNEIIWCYTGPGSPKMRQFNRKHDVLFWYSVGKRWVFNTAAVRMPHKDGAPHAGGFSGGGTKVTDPKYAAAGKVPETWWDETGSGMTPVRRLIKENTGYPTQKPLSLLERIIKASSNKGDLVFDPFCGCATTCVAAERLKRRWIGIDLSEEAAAIVLERMNKEVEIPLADPNAMVEHLRKPPLRTDLPKRTAAAVLKPRLYKMQNKRCAGPCGDNGEGRELPIDAMDIDHIIAKSRGGQDADDNLQLLCRNCNTVKGGKGMQHLRRQILERRSREAMREWREKWESKKDKLDSLRGEN